MLEALPMKIVIAPQGFKGSLDAAAVAAAIEAGVRRVWPDVQIELVPVADGGEGTLRAIAGATRGRIQATPVTGPLGENFSGGQ